MENERKEREGRGKRGKWKWKLGGVYVTGFRGG